MSGFALQLKWDGFQEFQDLLTQIEEDYGEKDAAGILRNAVRASMKPVLDAARQNLMANGNVDTGQLVQSLRLEARPPTAKDKRSIYSSPTYIMIARVTVAPGHRFEKDSKRLSKKFKNRKTGVKDYMHSDARAFAIEFGTAKWRAGEGMPFIRPALENNSQVVTDLLSQSLGTALLKYKSKYQLK